MSLPKIKITVTYADKKISEYVTAAVNAGKPYRFLHSKVLLSRLRIVKESIKNLTEEEQINVMRNTLIAERNIAALAAEQYAVLGQDVVFNDLMDIVRGVDELLNQ